MLDQGRCICLEKKGGAEVSMAVAYQAGAAGIRTEREARAS